MAAQWYKSNPRRMPLSIGVFLVGLLALHLMTGYQMVTHQPPAAVGRMIPAITISHLGGTNSIREEL